ncbi:MAG: element excision factor XisH family protein [Saprospiraceae bacterium]
MAKDIYHANVREALVKDGWTITDNPLPLLAENERWEIDLGSEKIFLAERGPEKIAVEVKSFIARSLSYEFHRAFGQYTVYVDAMLEQEPDRTIFLAVPIDVYDTLFTRPFYVKFLERHPMRLLVFDPSANQIVQWKK